MARPVLATMSVLAGAQVLTAGAALGEFVGPKVAAAAALVVAAVQAGMAFYVQGKVTPNDAVVVRRDLTTGTVVAGPAASAIAGEPTGLRDGTPVVANLTRP